MHPVYASVVQVSLKLIMWETIQEFFSSLVFSLIHFAQSSLWSDCLNFFTDVKKRSAKDQGTFSWQCTLNLQKRMCSLIIEIH